MVNEFRYALQFSKDNHIPIHVGEFGAYSKGDIESRELWTTFLARWFEEQGLSWAYWEFSAGFGIYNPSTKELITPLVDALLYHDMSEPTPIFATPIYLSDFSSTTDGWTLNLQDGASGALSLSNGKLIAYITNRGTEFWHVQLVKNNMAFENDKMYRIPFKAKATTDSGATFYAGKSSDPWNAYSGYNGISIETNESSFVFSFIMTYPSDPVARLVFDLGKNITGVTISEIKVEELRFVITSIGESMIEQQILCYPNPVLSTLHINGLDRYHSVEVFDLNGHKLNSFNVESTTSTINLEGFPQGIYLLRLSGNGLDTRIKILKE